MNNPNDLISREAAKAAIRNKFQSVSDRYEINEVLNGLPTIDTAPVVHARWRELKDDTEECTNCLGLCPHEENYNGDVIFNFGCEYCPWCGAKMDSLLKMTESYNNCINCAYYEEEWEYCFRFGTHTSKNGYCENYRDELPKEK